MYKSKMAPTSGNRRYSQPAVAGSSSSDKSRRGSEMTSNPRSTDNLTSSQYDDKLTVLEAKGPRKPRNTKDPGDGPSFDPDHYNPDGSLRTIHRIPNFETAYAEASRARYIRPPVVREQEKELTVKQIFDKCG